MASPLTQLDKVPTSFFSEHLWADYIEIVCLVNADRRVSKGDFLDRIRIGVDDAPKGSYEDADEDDGDGYEDSPAEIDDKWKERVDDWYRHLSYRAGIFGGAYPFSISGTGDVLIASQDYSLEQRLYIFLLLCANLRYCKSCIPVLTQTFERLSAEALRACLTTSAKVYIFGTSDNQEGHYAGTLWQKINKLAQDLGEKVLITEHDLPVPNVGDGGLDVVAWIPLGDDNSHRIVIFGQCACTLEWDSKQYTATALKWRQTITLSTDMSSIVFIPHALRRTDGSWHDKPNIATVMIDRPRFMHLVGNHLDEFTASLADEIVRDATAQTEDIF